MRRSESARQGVPMTTRLLIGYGLLALLLSASAIGIWWAFRNSERGVERRKKRARRARRKARMEEAANDEAAAAD
jgi:hypothetical protein